MEGVEMKKILLVSCLMLSFATTAFAGWAENFLATYQEKGIELAVEGALKEGQNPASIIAEGKKVEGLNIGMLLMALYCAGADGNDIKLAAEEAEISDILLVTAYEKSVNECGDKMADSQAYTPVSVAFAGMPTLSRNGGSSFASPSTFQ
jgi:hypothetical protein